MTNTGSAPEAALLAFLDKVEVPYRLFRHPPLYTVEDSKAHRGQMVGVHSKNLFLKEKKGGFTLVVCDEDRAIRLKYLEKAIGAKRLSFAPPEALLDVLGIVPGAVSPFALFNNRAEPRVRVILDQQMMAAGDSGAALHFHPLHNEAMLAVSAAGLRQFIAATGHRPEEVDFDALEARSEADLAG